jgi:hypothetical protein
VGQFLATLPAGERGATALALRASFAAGLNDLLYVTAGVALFGGVCSLLLIRRKDFVAREDAAPPPAPAGQEPAGQEPAGQEPATPPAR